jgi:hypothetical protein
LKYTVLLFLQKGGHNEEIIQKCSHSHAAPLSLLSFNRIG